MPVVIYVCYFSDNRRENPLKVRFGNAQPAPRKQYYHGQTPTSLDLSSFAGPKAPQMISSSAELFCCHFCSSASENDRFTRKYAFWSAENRRFFCKNCRILRWKLCKLANKIGQNVLILRKTLHFCLQNGYRLVYFITVNAKKLWRPKGVPTREYRCTVTFP